MKSNGLLGHIVALVVVMIWGGTFVNTRVLIDKGLSPEEIYVLRTLLAYVCIVVYFAQETVLRLVERRAYCIPVGNLR